MTVEIRKSKAELRTESEQALLNFLAAGGSITVVPAKKVKVKSPVNCKGTRARGGNGPLGYRTSSVFRGV